MFLCANFDVQENYLYFCAPEWKHTRKFVLKLRKFYGGVDVFRNVCCAPD